MNKKALREYEVLHKYEAGIRLLGSEVKSIKGGRLNFEGSYVKFIGNELFLINVDIPKYKYARNEDYDPIRTRKLLLKREEMTHLQSKIKMRPGLTLIPLKCYTVGSLIKLEIALSKGRKLHEIKSVEKEREIKRKDNEMTKEFLKKR